MPDKIVATGAANSARHTLTLRVAEKTRLGEDIFIFALARPDGTRLPTFTAGSHIAVTTPKGIVRRYSLCNSPAETERYLIAVKRERDGGGGSASMADDLAAGDLVTVGVPENYFPLSTQAQSHLLIAGGIGITPIMAMARQLMRSGQEFRLIYCARAPEAAAFLDELQAPPFIDRTLTHFDGGDSTKSLDLARIVVNRAPGSHLYCCGPRTLMNAVRGAAKHWPRGTVHFEDFGVTTPIDGADERGFRVRLARSGDAVEVSPGMTIVEALRQQGYAVPSSCESGTCGTCRTKLLAGIADHRDYVLDDSEHETDIMICVSRALSDEIVIDM